MDTNRAVEFIQCRMTELRLGPRDLKPLGGPSEDTARRFLRGDIPPGAQSATLQKFDIALGWKLGSLREILFFAGEPTLNNDYGTARGVAEELGPNLKEWCVIQRWMIQDLAVMVAELVVLTKDTVGPITESVTRTHTLVTDMVAMMGAGGRSPEELARMAEILERGI